MWIPYDILSRTGDKTDRGIPIIVNEGIVRIPWDILSLKDGLGTGWTDGYQLFIYGDSGDPLGHPVPRGLGTGWTEGYQLFIWG